MIPATQTTVGEPAPTFTATKVFGILLNFDSLLDQQFVGENAQAIDCCGFHSQDDWTERNWLAAVTTRERKFRGREIAFGSNKHQDTASTMLMLTRIICENFL
jgi:hypothetical protein